MNTSPLPSSIRIPVQRICSEYLEMPGLRLTNAQAQRLLGLEAAVCNDALTFLADAGFLRLTPGGQYARMTDDVIVCS